MKKYKNFSIQLVTKLSNFILFKNSFFHSSIFVFLLFFLMLFTRSIVGVYILDIRFGEILVLISFLSSLIILSFIFKDSTIFDSKVILLFKLFIVFFFVTSYVTNTDLLRPYAFRTSSYIWTISYLFVGAYLISKKNIKILKSSILFLFLIYLFSSGNYPEFLIDLFYKYSDKFQFIKGSEITLAYICIILLNYKLFGNNKINLSYIIIFGALFIPILLVASRGAFLGAIIFIILELFYRKDFIFKNVKFFVILIFLSTPLFLISTLRVTDNDQIAQIASNPQQEIELALNDVVTKKDITSVFLGFYITNYGYLDSTDPTTSWRLDIWQDVFYDMKSKNILIKGYGYNEIIPVMTDPTAPGRLGWDGLNENVHNYFVNILARGGLFQLLIALCFHIYLVWYFKKRHGNYRILSFTLPLLFIASLDAAMEGVNFPIIFYSLYGYFIKNGID